jgi:hypothetical protein
MTDELKTLKDIFKDSETHCIILRQEAIKEIKLLKRFATWQIVRNGAKPEIPFQHEEWQSRTGVISYLIWKYNLTEKELE